MALVFLRGQMVRDTTANMKTIRDMASEFVKTRTAKFIKENGSKDKCMEKEN